MFSIFSFNCWTIIVFYLLCNNITSDGFCADTNYHFPVISLLLINVTRIHHAHSTPTVAAFYGLCFAM